MILTDREIKIAIKRPLICVDRPPESERKSFSVQLDRSRSRNL